MRGAVAVTAFLAFEGFVLKFLMDIQSKGEVGHFQE